MLPATAPPGSLPCAERHTVEYREIGLTLQVLSGYFLPNILEARLGILVRGAHSGVGSMTHR